jgi:hypothetical protein
MVANEERQIFCLASKQSHATTNTPLLPSDYHHPGFKPPDAGTDSWRAPGFEINKRSVVGQSGNPLTR